MTIDQLDSALASCRRVEAENIIVRTQAMFFACQTSGQDMGKFLKSFRELLEAPREDDQQKFQKLWSKSKSKR